QAMGDRLAVMMGGSIRQIGTPEEVFAAPASEEVAAFVGVENILRGVVAQASDGLVTVRVAEREVAVVGGYSPGDELVMGIRPEEVVLEPLPRGVALTSARNRLAGRITGILPLGAQARVVVDCGFRIVSLVTRQSVLDLALTEGTPVLASFKASAIHVIR
ncbi:MAG: TOBE domain-containing protein, partial [Chloroflexota bacterium]|nr:TOBE domain-containing protein [Chloroflexota bacterium]